MSQLTKAEMISDTASPATRVSGQVDQFLLTKRQISFNKRIHIRSNKRGIPADDCNSVPTSENLQLQDHVTLNVSIHGGSPKKSRDHIQVNSVTYPMIKFNYDYIPHANPTDKSARTVESQPSRSSLLVEKKGKTL